jgi:hypothetical protein
MLRLLIALSVLFYVSTACHSVKNISNSTVLEIRYGTSFGHCRGYCTHELILSKQLATYSEISRDTIHFPLKQHQTFINESFFKEVNQAYNLDSLKLLPDRIGCPDCADGGSEYLIVVTTTGTKKTTFEYGNIPESLKKVVDLLHAKSKELSEKE